MLPNMNILLSNDDGYRAPGLVCLADTLQAMPAVNSVTVVAPDRNRSGASNSLTLDNPLRVSRMDNGFFSVNGTPTDCVHLAITGLLETPPDIVISGINEGANLGDDVLYSGTVAAAMEGRFLGLPAMAVSLASFTPNHYPTAARLIRQLLENLAAKTLELPLNTLLNINVPDLPWEQLAGIRAARLGHRHKAEPVIKSRDPRGQAIYWIGPPGKAQDAGEGTDFYALRHGFASITPLQVDLTRHSAVEVLNGWLELQGLS